MQIVLATSNKGKIKEIKKFLSPMDVKEWGEFIKPFEIEEDGNTFQENALIKSRAVFKALNDNNLIVLSDDSGISVPLLGGEPGIHSARYAGVDATSKDNRMKLIQTLKAKGVEKTLAFYTTCMAISCKWGDFSVHGFMYGDAIAKLRGENGFGYDSLFIPKNETRTLAQMKDEEKIAISHRTKALKLATILIQNLPKG